MSISPDAPKLKSIGKTKNKGKTQVQLGVKSLKSSEITELQKGGSWQRLLEIIESKPLLGSARAGCPGPCPVGFCISPWMAAPQGLRKICSSVSPLSLYKRKKVLSFFMFKWILVFQFVPTSSHPVTGYH